MAGPENPVSTFEQTNHEQQCSNRCRLLFRVSFALDHSADLQVALIESPDAAGVFQGMKQQFPFTYENMLISAIVESRQSDGTTAKIAEQRNKPTP